MKTCICLSALRWNGKPLCPKQRVTRVAAWGIRQKQWYIPLFTGSCTCFCIFENHSWVYLLTRPKTKEKKTKEIGREDKTMVNVFCIGAGLSWKCRKPISSGLISVRLQMFRPGWKLGISLAGTFKTKQGEGWRSQCKASLPTLYLAETKTWLTIVLGEYQRSYSRNRLSIFHYSLKCSNIFFQNRAFVVWCIWLLITYHWFT